MSELEAGIADTALRADLAQADELMAARRSDRVAATWRNY
jgi:hypothetical protein